MPLLKRKTSGPANWLDEAPEVPRENLPVFKDRRKAQARWRMFLRATIILLPLALFANLLMVGQLLRPPAAVEQGDREITEGKAAAVLAVEQWVEGPVSPLAGGGKVLSWDGFDVVDRPEQTAQQKSQDPLPAWNLEIHHFTVSDGLGVVYGADVQVAVGDKVGASAISTPTLLPRATADTSTLGTAEPWYAVQSAQAPDAVQTAITSWATAFTGGDPDALRVNVQDDDGKRTYVPLYNVASHTVTVVTSGYPLDGEVVDESRMIVQVQMEIEWAGSEPLRNGERRPVVTYDLLVTRADTGAPVVVAWGAPGSGPQLTAFQNALQGREVVAPDCQIESAPRANEEQPAAEEESN